MSEYPWWIALISFSFFSQCFIRIFSLYISYQSVQVMGTFDGWIQGEQLSPEYTGSYTKFSTTLLLRPGRYHSIDSIDLVEFLFFCFYLSSIFFFRFMKIWNQVLGGWRVASITRIPYSGRRTNEKQLADCGIAQGLLIWLFIMFRAVDITASVYIEYFFFT